MNSQGKGWRVRIRADFDGPLPPEDLGFLPARASCGRALSSLMNVIS